MYKKIRALARIQRQATIDEANRSLTEGDAVDLEALHKQLEVFGKIARLRGPFDRFVRVVLPLFVTSLILVPAWMIRHPAPTIYLSLEAGRVDVALDATRALSLTKPPVLESLYINGIAELHVDQPGLNFSNTIPNGTVHISGRSYLSDLKLDPFQSHVPAREARSQDLARLVFERTPERMRISMSGMEVAAHVTIDTEATLMSFDGIAPREATLREAGLMFRGPDSTPAEVQVHFTLDSDATTTQVLHPLSIAFEHVRFDHVGDAVLHSSIRKGVLTVASSGRSYELGPGTRPILGALDGELIVTQAGDRLVIHFRGTSGVAGIWQGPSLPPADVRPRLAEWLASDRTVGLVWSGVMFVIGLVWTVRGAMAGGIS